MSMRAISNLDAAIEALKEKHKKWQAEHPDEENIPVCPICGGSGLNMLIYDEFGKQHSIMDRYKPGMYEYFEPCPCTKSEMSMVLKNNKNFSTVPPLYEDARIGNFVRDVYKQVRSMELFQAAKNDAIRFITAFPAYEAKGTGLYIWSREKGSGKSRLASTICNEMTIKGVRNKYTSASDILSEIQASWNTNGVSESDILKKYAEPRLLVIDDLGVRSGKDWINDRFTDLIDNRYKNKRPTIITSNYEPEKLPFDERITDRVCSDEKFFKIHMPEESVRKNKKPNEESDFREIYEKYVSEHKEDGDEQK